MNQRFEELQNRREELLAKIRQVENEQVKLRQQLNNIDYEIHKLLIRRDTDEFIKEMLATPIEDTMKSYLDTSTQTINLMDRFYKSEKKLLFLRNVNGGRLIVSRYRHGLDIDDSNLTISILKRNMSAITRRNLSFGFIETGRMAALCKQLNIIASHPIEYDTIIPFDQPCVLHAQIQENREGYGNEYWGAELMVEGTQYGETTSFLIVGVCFHNPSALSYW